MNMNEFDNDWQAGLTITVATIGTCFIIAFLLFLL